MSTQDQNILSQLQRARMPKAKKEPTPIPKQSNKKKAQVKAEKEAGVKPKVYTIPKRSKKEEKRMREYKPLVKAYLEKEENQICLILSPVCTKVATCVNHKRRRGKNLMNEADWEPACGPCNSYVESNSLWAYENGHLESVHKKKDQ